MARFIPLSASLLGVSVLSFGAAAQSAAPSPPADASSDNDATALAKKLQNPIGDLYSVPFRNNTNFNSGPNKGTQDILNIQPVIHIHSRTGTLSPALSCRWSGAHPSSRRRVSRSALRRLPSPHFSRQRTRSMAGSGASGRSPSCPLSPARRWAPM